MCAQPQWFLEIIVLLDDLQEPRFNDLPNLLLAKKRDRLGTGTWLPQSAQGPPAVLYSGLVPWETVGPRPRWFPSLVQYWLWIWGTEWRWEDRAP